MIAAIKTFASKLLDKITRSRVRVERQRGNPDMVFDLTETKDNQPFGKYSVALGDGGHHHRITYYLSNMWTDCDDVDTLIAWLMVIDLHEMSHWGNELDFSDCDEDHSARWNPLLAEELDYVSDDATIKIT